MDPAPTLPPGQFSDDFSDFISICLNKQVNERANYTQLLDHQFLISHEEVEDCKMGSFIKGVGTCKYADPDKGSRGCL